MDYTILINDRNRLSNEYIPNNLVFYPEYNGEKIDKNYVTLVEFATLKSFYELQKDALKLGFHIIIDSGYRSFDYQKSILDSELKKKGKAAYNYVAKPGASEHQSGLAIDIALYRDGKYCDLFTDSDPELLWLYDNAYKYGFILRYPKGYEHITGVSYEFWHFRYVGIDTASYMHSNNILTLEEYHCKIRQK